MSHRVLKLLMKSIHLSFEGPIQGAEMGVYVLSNTENLSRHFYFER